MIHALRTHAKRTLAAAFAAAFALGSALTLSACSGKPAKQTGSNSTPVPQTLHSPCIQPGRIYHYNFLKHILLY